MTTDMLGRPLSETEISIVALYDNLKTLLSDPELAPSAQSNLRDALASVSIVVTELALDYETLHDHWV